MNIKKWLSITLITLIYLLSNACGGTNTEEQDTPHQVCISFNVINHSNYLLNLSFSPDSETYPSPTTLPSGDHKEILYMCTFSNDSNDIKYASTILDTFSVSIDNDEKSKPVYSGIIENDWVIISSTSTSTTTESEMVLLLMDENLAF